MVPKGSSHKPGRLTRPEKPINLVPVSLRLPALGPLYHSTPLGIMDGMLLKVSTLVMLVGLTMMGVIVGQLVRRVRGIAEDFRERMERAEGKG